MRWWHAVNGLNVVVTPVVAAGLVTGLLVYVSRVMVRVIVWVF